MINIGRKITQEKQHDHDSVVMGSGTDKNSFNASHAVGTDTWAKEIRRKCMTAVENGGGDAGQIFDAIQAKRIELYKLGVHPVALEFHKDYQDILYPL